MQEPKCVQEVQELLERNEKGFVKNSLSNCVTVFRYDPLLCGNIRYNLLTQKVDILKDLGWKREDCTNSITDNDVHNIHLYLEQTYSLTQVKLIEEALHLVAHDNEYHPIREHLNHLQWDGKERVRYALNRFLGAEISDYTCELLKFFMLGAIHRAFNPGCKFDYILCLVGEQGIGKSSFFRFLSCKDEWFSDDLKNLESETVFQKMAGHWIIELAEMLATYNAKSNEATKAFLSRQKETFRTPYERYPKDRPRQCVFGGTTNTIAFLPHDRSGNRRFMPIRCHQENVVCNLLENEEESRAYFEQMWAEVMEIYRNENPPLKLSEEMEATLEVRRKEFMQEDVDAGLILAFMTDTDKNRVCSKLLYREALDHPYGDPKRWQTNDICEIVNQLIADGRLIGWQRFNSPKRILGYGTQKGWERIPSGDVNQQASTDASFMPVPDQLELPFTLDS